MYSYYELSIMHRNKKFYDVYSNVEQTLEISLNRITKNMYQAWVIRKHCNKIHAKICAADFLPYKKIQERINYYTSLTKPKVKYILLLMDMETLK